MSYLAKDEFVRRVAKKANLSIVATQNLLQIIGEVGTEALQQGHEFTIPSIGRVKTTVRRPRQCRNPQTNQPLNIPGKMSARLSPSVGLMRALNNHGQDDAASTSASGA